MGWDVVVIGGGPAGCVAAGYAALQGARVLLLEKNRRCGAKLLITGKGRCNLTHDEADPRRLSSAFGTRGKALLTALYAFGPEQVRGFFEQRGLPLATERGGRIFPAEGGAREVQRVVEGFLAETGVTVRTGCPVATLECRQGHVIRALGQGREFAAGRFVIATGGLSYPETGCTGDGYAWATETGHALIAPQPALVAVQLEESWTRQLISFNLRNVRITARQGDRVVAERFGEAFFTRDGLGGPIVLDMSAAIRDALQTGPVSLHLDLKPAVAPDLFDKRLQRELAAHSNRDFRNALGNLLPQAMIPLYVELSGIPPDRKCHSVTRSERQGLLKLFKGLELHVTAVEGFARAIVTSGGVALRDIDMRSMRSKRVDNLYFAGEMIDLDGPTGGYNLQLCWSTGYLAGINAGRAPE